MNKSLKILFLYNGIFIFAANLLGPLYAKYVEKLDTGIFSISLTWAVFLISSTIFTYFVAKYGDRFKKKEYMLLIGYLIRSIVWMLFIFITDVTSLIIVQILLGVGEAFGNPAFDSIFAEHLDRNRHVADYADYKIVEKLALALATLVGGAIVNIYGFNVLFILMSVFSFIPVIGIFLKPKILE